jgi:alcohol dehydrogenase class IV
MYDTPHAVTHAIVLPYAVKFVRPAVPAAIARLATAMGTASEELPSAIWSLGRAVGTPKGLRAIGITESQVEQVAEAALAKGLISPRVLNRSLVCRLLEGAWRGMSPLVP